MNTSSLSLAALALLGAMAMSAPALAAESGPDGLNCKDPAVQNDARCLAWAKRNANPWAGVNKTAPDARTTTPSPRDSTRQRRDQTDVTPVPDNGPATSNQQRRRGDMTNNDDNNRSFDRNFDSNRNSDNNRNYDDNRNSNDNSRYDRRDDNGSSFNRDRRSFREFRRSFDFPRFARPFFDIRPGAVVPRQFRLRTVPREILFYYPEYRGYLYFVTSRDDVVIVSPRSYRIVAIL